MLPNAHLSGSGGLLIIPDQSSLWLHLLGFATPCRGGSSQAFSTASTPAHVLSSQELREHRSRERSLVTADILFSLSFPTQGLHIHLSYP